MHELDHMLNGKSSRQHHQDILRAVQYERLAREVEANQRRFGSAPRQAVRQLRAALSAVVQTILG